MTDDGEWKPVGGEFTMPRFLSFMPGYDPERSTLTGYVDGVPWHEMWDEQYSEHDVIRALTAEVRRLRKIESKTMNDDKIPTPIWLMLAAWVIALGGSLVFVFVVNLLHLT